MRRITCMFVAFGLAASLAVAQEGAGCPSSKASDAKPTALATARKALANAPKAEEKLTADQRAELKKAREFMMQTSFGKSMGPSFEACGWLTLAASAQPGTSPDAAALLKDMGATYCAVAKVFGACAESTCCENAEECCKACSKDMTPEAMAKKATESRDAAKKLVAAGMADFGNMTPEQGMKLQASLETMQKFCPVMPAMEGANTALDAAFASLAKMGIPSTDAKNAVRDGLVKGALDLHTQMNCSSCEECEGCDDAEETEEVATPNKSS